MPIFCFTVLSNESYRAANDNIITVYSNELAAATRRFSALPYSQIRVTELQMILLSLYIPARWLRRHADFLLYRTLK